MLVDSHCHLNYLDAPGDCLARARARGVQAFLCIGVDAPHIDEVLGLAAREPDVWATVGQHPEAADADWGWVESHLEAPRVVAIGETGLDYHHVEAAEGRKRQLASFDHHLDLAGRHDLPVVVHTRAAEQDTLAVLGNHPDVVGVLHCFTESWQMAEAALGLGYYVSISGIVTFRNGDNVRAVAEQVPAERLLVETDAPWLAPVPHRGSQNEPAFVLDTAEFLATLRGVSVESLSETTGRNFLRLFNRIDPGRVELDRNAAS